MEEGTDGEGVVEEKRPEPEKAFTQEQLDKIIADRLVRQRKSLESDIRKGLLADDHFREEALDAWNVKQGGGEEAELDDGKVRELYQAWEAKNVVPLQERAESLEARLNGLSAGMLEVDLLSAAPGVGIQKALLKKQANSHSALFTMLQGNFGQDDDGNWRVLGSDGHFRPSPAGDKLYMEPAEYVREWAKDPDNAVFIDDSTQGGASFADEASASGKRVYTRAEYKSLVADEAYYAKHRDELHAADREGRVR